MPLPTSTTPAGVRPARTAHRLGVRRWAGLLALAATLATLAFAGQANAAVTTINVNPSSGQDTNPGSISAPVRTLTKALKLAHAGDSVKLAGGVYGPGFSGDQFRQSGLIVPSGVTITGATSSGFPTVTLLGPGNAAALNLAGDATVRNLTFGGSGFGVGVFAKQGKQTLSNLVLSTTKGSTVIDGRPAAAGILLRGTAQANLTAGAAQSITGATLLVNASTGVAVQQQARFAMHGVQIKLADGANGVVGIDQARLTMDGGTITGGAANCGINATAVALRDAAQATLQNGAKLENVPGFGIFMGETAKATVSSATITRENTAGCQGRPSIDAFGSATLITNGTSFASSGGQEIDAIRTSRTVRLALTNTDIHGFTGTGIGLQDNETLTIDGGSIHGNTTGINARTAAGGTPHIKIAAASLIGKTTGIEVDQPILKLRDSTVTSNETGIDVRGEVGGLPIGDTCAFACVNLGTQEDPGHNNLAGNTGTAVEIRHGSGTSGVLSGVPAVGNVWNSNTQGANSDGRYQTPLIVNAGDLGSVGHNFELSGISTLIQLAAAPVGRLHITPSALHTRAGKVVHLALRWTHPHSWTQLKAIQLRAYLRGTVVGTITLRPHTSRLSASGATEIIARDSRVTHRGKTVTARLALRLARSLAAKQLRLAVQATDRHGHSQLEVAGRIRVAR